MHQHVAERRPVTLIAGFQPAYKSCRQRRALPYAIDYALSGLISESILKPPTPNSSFPIPNCREAVSARRHCEGYAVARSNPAELCFFAGLLRRSAPRNDDALGESGMSNEVSGRSPEINSVGQRPTERNAKKFKAVGLASARYGASPRNPDNRLSACI